MTGGQQPVFLSLDFLSPAANEEEEAPMTYIVSLSLPVAYLSLAGAFLRAHMNNIIEKRFFLLLPPVSAAARGCLQNKPRRLMNIKRCRVICFLSVVTEERAAAVGASACDPLFR